MAQIKNGHQITEAGTQSKIDRSVNLLYKLIELVVNVSNENFLQSKICQALTEHAGYRMAWIGRLEYNETRAITPLVYAGHEDNYLETIRLKWSESESEADPGGLYVSIDQTVVQAISDSYDEEQRSEALKRGYYYSASIPVMEDSRASKIVFVYSDNATDFGEDEIKFIESAASILAIGLRTIKEHMNYHEIREQLEQAQKMESISKLTGGIAHDFNNILGAVLGFNALAQERIVVEEDKKLQEYLREVQLAGERARVLVAKLLAFSRAKPGEKKELKLPLLVGDVAKMMRSSIQSSIEIKTEFESGIEKVFGDAVQIQQTLVNLILNARDAMKNGKGNILISLGQEDVISRICCNSCHEHFNGKFITLSVKDDGLGITNYEMERIFEPFYTTKEDGKGAGMGLSMVHGIVHSIGGHIKVNRSEEGGAEFRLYLPPYRVDTKILSRKLH